MKTLKAILGCCFLLSLTIPIALLAQPTRWDMRYYSVAEGLSQNTVHCLMQDEQGFIWLGTEDGLNRFDGYAFTIWRNRPESANSLINNWVEALLQDREGYIWVGTKGGLSRYDPRRDTWLRVPLERNTQPEFAEAKIRALLEDAQGQLWIATTGGLLRLDNPQAPPEDWQVRSFPALAYGFPEATVAAMFPDDQGQIWFALGSQTGEVSNGGLYRYDPDTDRFQGWQQDPLNPQSLRDNQLTALLIDPEGQIWAGTVYGGLHLSRGPQALAQNTFHSLSTEMGLPHPFISALALARPDQLWVGTYDGLAYLNPLQPERATVLATPSPVGRVRSLLVDKVGNIWVGTVKGCWKIQPRPLPFETYQKSLTDPLGLPAGDIFALLETSRGEIWASMYDYGLVRYLPDGQGSWHKHIYRPSDFGLPTAMIVGMQEDAEGHLWLSSFAGLLRLTLPPVTDPTHPPDPILKVWQQEAGNPRSLSSNYLNDVLQRRDQSIWLSHFTTGLEHLGPAPQYEVIERAQENPDDPFSILFNWAYTLQEDRAGNLWFGGNRGLSRMYRGPQDEMRFRHLLLPPVDSSKLLGLSMDMFYEDEAGVFWIASDGLFRVEFAAEAEQSPWEEGVSPILPITWRYYGVSDGLANQHLYGVLPDGKGNLWLSHNQGLSRFDPRTETFKNFPQEAGLQSNEFSANAFAKGSQGHLYFGGINGFNRFHPDSIHDGEIVPRAVLTEMKLYNQALSVGVPLEESDFVLDQTIFYQPEVALSWREYVVGFEFAGLGFTTPERYQYAYQMQGLDADWVYSGNRRFATYTNLEPGRYTFAVKAANEDGIWQAEPTTLKVTVSTPPWKTVWAYLLYGLLVIALVSWIVWARTQKVRRELATQARIEKAKVEEREQVRARSSRDFHDEAGNKITKLSLYTGLLRQQLADQPPLQEILQKVEGNIQDLGRGMRDFIWVLDPQQDNLRDTAERIRDFGQTLFADTGLGFVYQQEITGFETQALDLNLRRHLLMICKEALHNALKYAEAREVRLKIEVRDGELRVQIQDNGLGFDWEQRRSAGHGLRNMQSRAEECGATLEMQSTPGIGTHLVFSKALLKST